MFLVGKYLDCEAISLPPLRLGQGADDENDVNGVVVPGWVVIIGKWSVILQIGQYLRNINQDLEGRLGRIRYGHQRWPCL